MIKMSSSSKNSALAYMEPSSRDNIFQSNFQQCNKMAQNKPPFGGCAQIPLNVPPAGAMEQILHTQHL